ncbi:MAG: alpha/beta fold hydrolase [Candidatus Margulisiibacteriota bacterium]
MFINPIKQIAFPSREDNLAIAGLLFESAENRGTVIFCHGRGDTKERFVDRYITLSKMLIDNGYNILAFDFRGHGLSARAQYSFGYHEQKDVLGAIDYLKSSRCNSETVGILGFSLGACASMLAVEKTKGIKALVSESGYSSYEDVTTVFDENNRPIPKKSPEHKKAVEAYKKGLGWDFNISPIDNIGNISPCALFLIDGSIEEEDNMLMFGKACEPKEIWIIPGAAHGQVYFMAQKEYDKRVLDFFLRHLK